MNILDKLNEEFNALNIKAEELPERTRRKLDQVKQTLTSKLKTIRDSEGRLKPAAQEKVRELVQSIREEIRAFAASRPPADPPAADPPAGDPPAGDPPAGDPPPVKKSSGLFDWLLG